MLSRDVQPVEDASGDRYLLEKRSRDAWLVLDPETGESVYRDPEALTVLAETAPLEAVVDGLETSGIGSDHEDRAPEPLCRLLGAVHSRRSLGLAVTIVDRGPIGVRTLLDDTTLCESDLHGTIAELAAAGLLEETDVVGERGYAATADAERAVAALRDRNACE